MKKRADGRYCKQILVGFSPDGKRKMKTIYGKTIKEVERKERELRDNIDCGLRICENMTVSEWCDIWIKTFKTNVENNTLARYEGIIKNQIKPYIGHLQLTNIRHHIIQGIINDLKQNLSPASIKKIKDVLHQIFEEAVRSQYISINPVNGVDIPQIKQTERMPVPEEHIKKIVEFCKEYENGCFVMTLLYTGMRRGEILALTVEDIDFETNNITINKAIEFIKNKPHVKCPKTRKSNRIVPILEPLIPYLRNITEGKSKKDILFCNSKGMLHDKSSAQRLFKDFNKRYNMHTGGGEYTHFTMHQFRHTFCTMLYNAGVDIKTAQDILGHSSVNVTLNIYTHLDTKTKKINTEKLNNYILSL